MNPPPSPALADEARPIDASERLVLLDVLRGFALGGVFVSNVFGWFTGRAFLPRAQLEAPLAGTPWWDVLAIHGIAALVNGRFMTLFSFLFGLGFSVQLLRAEARGASIAPLYTRRLCVLFLIGAVHLLGIWYGDILTTYAPVGLLLLLFRGRSDKELLVWATLLILVIPIGVAAGMQWLSGPGPAAGTEAARVLKEQADANRAERLDTFLHGSYPDVVGAHARFYFGEFVRRLPPMLCALFGRFLLGFLAGRRRLFHDVSRHLPFFRALLRWSLVVGALGTIATLGAQYLIRQKLLDAQGLSQYYLRPVRQLAELGLAAFYASGLVLLFQRERWQRRLRVLAPVGRMALTNYLAQSVLSLLMYYGFGLGLMGRVGPAASIALTLAVFAVQVAFSHVWLARFRFGPAEWLWRSLTYGKAQPFRQNKGVVAPSS
ncbi:hypothetical protein D187_001976 [Cystobacter fuscus DSM 2262]|uniref:DUF418 domain-containing protein n=1 Tax=Cystobacter fuscus (strain ATCC 25194 / DSM 2262 / NBRC 100088 / M29) TaxID=1242864 RepID=S9QGP4_CYSF2|nr:DUF418 domain-containing protein [Cystobacter fuscus]EPX60489.1 hypothetical protein D187_001976 [Cystobacter fuscus DSM 2262]